MLGEVLWDTGALDGHHVERWRELLVRSRLAITWSKEEFDVPSCIGGTVQPTGVTHRRVRWRCAFPRG